MSDYQILLFYKYTDIADPEAEAAKQREMCERLGLKCRSIVAREGLNVTLEGTKEATEQYIQELTQDQRFMDIHFKRSTGTGDAFPKISVKIRPEIVSLHLGDQDIDPNFTTGKYLKPEELHEWFETDKEFYIVDMRNDYEHEVGHFENSILPALRNFRDLPDVLPELESLKDKTVLTVCTGGVRCEKASGYLVNNGFNDVYQLYGGIVSYMEAYPNQNFLGKLYVFDGRVTMGFNTDAPEHQVIGKCHKCGQPADTYTDCAYIHCKQKRHFITCSACQQTTEGKYCCHECAQLDTAE